MNGPLNTLAAAVGLALALCTANTRAAHQIPPKLHGAGQDEQTVFIQEEGQRSLREKLQAGQERLARRQEFRAALVQGMRANVVNRKEYETVSTYPALTRLRVKSESVWLPWALLALLASSWFAVQWCRTGRVYLFPPREQPHGGATAPKLRS